MIADIRPGLGIDENQRAHGTNNAGNSAETFGFLASHLARSYNKRVSGSAHCVRLDPNPRYARTSDTRQPLCEIVSEPLAPRARTNGETAQKNNKGRKNILLMRKTRWMK